MQQGVAGGHREAARGFEMGRGSTSHTNTRKWSRKKKKARRKKKYHLGDEKNEAQAYQPTA